jgi:hypothetical protein
MSEEHETNGKPGLPILSMVSIEKSSIERISSHPVNAIIFLAPISAFDQALAEVIPSHLHICRIVPDVLYRIHV